MKTRAERQTEATSASEIKQGDHRPSPADPGLDGYRLAKITALLATLPRYETKGINELIPTAARLLQTCNVYVTRVERIAILEELENGLFTLSKEEWSNKLKKYHAHLGGTRGFKVPDDAYESMMSKKHPAALVLKKLFPGGSTMEQRQVKLAALVEFIKPPPQTKLFTAEMPRRIIFYGEDPQREDPQWYPGHSELEIHIANETWDYSTCRTLFEGRCKQKSANKGRRHPKAGQTEEKG